MQIFLKKHAFKGFAIILCQISFPVFAEQSRFSHIPDAAVHWRQFSKIVVGVPEPVPKKEYSVSGFMTDLKDYEILMNRCRNHEFYPYLNLHVAQTGGIRRLFSHSPLMLRCNVRQTEDKSKLGEYLRRHTFRDMKISPFETYADNWPEAERNRFLKSVSIYREWKRTGALHPAVSYWILHEKQFDSGLIRSHPWWQTNPASKVIEHFEYNLLRHISDLENPESSSSGSRKERFENQAVHRYGCAPCGKVIPYALKSVERILVQSEIKKPDRSSLQKIRRCLDKKSLTAEIRVFRLLNYFRFYGNEILTMNLAGIEDGQYRKFHESIRQLLYRQKLFSDRTQYVESVICEN